MSLPVRFHVRLVSLLLSRLLAIPALIALIFGVWYWWGTHGAAWMLGKIEGTDSASLRSSKDLIEKLGQTGDIFGGANALFAALAFIGVAIAAFFQYKTLRLVEVSHRIEVFEPLFFKLLDRVDGSFTAGFNIPKMGSAYTVNRYVHIVMQAFHEFSDEIARAGSKTDARAVIRRKYQDLHDSNSAVLGPYFRSLYQVFSLIDDAEIDFKRKIRYANIARASIPPTHLKLLALNCCCDPGEDFRVLVERYGLLKYLPTNSNEDLLSPVTDLILSSAFEDTARMGFMDRIEYLADQNAKRKGSGEKR